MNNKPLILTMFSNEDYHLRLSKINANFVILDCPGAQKISCKLPDNHIIVKDLTPNIRPDVVISQSKLYHYSVLHGLANKYKRPLISVYIDIPTRNDLMISRNHKSNADVFFSMDQANSWQTPNPVIIPPCPLIESFDKKPELYISKLSDFGAFYKVLDAMARGACVVGAATYEMNNIITQSYNGFLYKKDDPNGEKNLVAKIIRNEELVLEIGKNAQKTIAEKFSIKNFVNNWDNLISEKTR